MLFSLAIVTTIPNLSPWYHILIYLVIHLFFAIYMYLIICSSVRFVITFLLPIQLYQSVSGWRKHVLYLINGCPTLATPLFDLTYPMWFNFQSIKRAVSCNHRAETKFANPIEVTSKFWMLSPGSRNPTLLWTRIEKTYPSVD